MDFGLPREQLVFAFWRAIESNARDVKAFRERAVRASLGEFPSDQEMWKQVLPLFETTDPVDLVPAMVLAFIDIIDTNNKLIGEQVEAMLEANS